MITVPHDFEGRLSSPGGAGASTVRPVRLALCSFAVPADAGQGERQQAALALRYMQQQLARLGAQVLLPAPLPGDAGVGDGALFGVEVGAEAGTEVRAEVDGVVVFPAFCPSLAALDSVLAGASRPGLVMALSTGFEDDCELAANYGNALASMRAAPAQDDAGCMRSWIGGTLFDVRVWFDAAVWLSALQTSMMLTRRGAPARSSAPAAWEYAPA